MSIRYRSITTLTKQLRSWSSELPQDLDLIVGIPRSGMLVANILALQKDLLFTDIDGFLEGRIIKAGRRSHELPLSKKLNVLVVDDNVCTARQLDVVKQRIKEANLPHTIYYAAVYMEPGKEHKVDFFYEHLPIPILFEWNLKRYNFMLTSCFDIDGVLCVDPKEHEEDDGVQYEHFLKNAKPLMVPSSAVGWLVTGRLEKYRKLTEDWLNKHGVKYRELFMMNFPDRKSQIAAYSQSAFKASVYKSTHADLFIESSVSQAVNIAFLAQKNVLCMDTREMVTPVVKNEISCEIKDLQKALMNQKSVLKKETDRITTDLDWSDKLNIAIRETLRIVPVGESFIIVDNDRLGINLVFAGRHAIPFLEKDGYYNGPPPNDLVAIENFKKILSKGANYLVITWTAFWWIDHYKEWHAYLRSNFTCLLENDQVIIFDLCNKSSICSEAMELQSK